MTVHPSDIVRATCYWEGYNARLAGISLNPYPSGSNEAGGWADGYMTCLHEMNKNKEDYYGEYSEV